MNDFCKCGNVNPTATIWHAWRVNWKAMPQKIRDYLKYKYLCKECKQSVKDQIKYCLSIMDEKGMSNENGSCQALFNDYWHDVRGALLNIVDAP